MTIPSCRILWRRSHRGPAARRTGVALVLLAMVAVPLRASVTITQDARDFWLSNGPLTAQVARTSGELLRLRVGETELLGGNRGYWSWVGDSEDEEIGGRDRAADSFLRIDPATNHGARGEVAVVTRYTGRPGQLPLDVETRYALEERSGDLAITAVLRHGTNHPALRLGEARYAVKLDGRLFDYMAIDEARHGPMPSGADWDAGKRMNLEEARQIRTGPFAGKVEHKYGYSAILADTPAYGWASTSKRLGVWLINPSPEYLAGGPTKVELTAHLDGNRGGAPTILNMWLGSHYGGSDFALTNGQVWAKQIGPFFLRINGGRAPEALWREAQSRAQALRARWPCAWADDAPAPRGAVRGRLVLRDVFAPGAVLSGLRVGLARPGSDWQKDALGYQFWTAAEADGSFAIPDVRPGTYTLHAFATDVIGDFSRERITVSPGRTTDVQTLEWLPDRHGRTVWQIGVVDRTAAEFRHGDDYWKWGRYLRYASEFSNGVDFVIGQSNPRRDWNYCQPPRQGSGWGRRDTSQRIRFTLDRAPVRPLHLRLAFCGARERSEIVVLANEREAGRTGPLPPVGTMHRDGIRGYWFERQVTLATNLLRAGTNMITLCLQAREWHEGVLYDAIRLEAEPALRLALAGDSTVCEYPSDHACRGWGQFIGESLGPEVQVLNFAKSGRSTRSFRAEGLWSRLLATRPDVVLIQFGHNDSHGAGRPESTDAATDFREHLRVMIEEARAIGARPVLITPMHRRTFRADGTLNDNLQPYADAMAAVGAETGVPVLALHRTSGELLRTLGEAESMGRHANAPDDRTHFNEAGARAMADLILRELPAALPELPKR